MGLNETTPAIEDDLCAQLIRKRLQNRPVHYQEYIKPIMNSPGFKRLNNLKQQKDIFYCLTQDILPKIALYDKNQKNIKPI